MLDHISVSQFSTFSRCEKQWAFRYILKKVVAPNPAMLIGTATHDGVEYAYLQKWTDDKYIIDECKDVARDKIDHDIETEWDKMDKPTAIDHSVNMVKAYADGGYLDAVKQEEIVGIEKKKPLILKQKDGELIKIVGVADLVLADRIIDFKTSGKKKTKPDNYNRLQCSVYSYAYRKDSADIHAMSYKKAGAEANDYSVPIMPLNLVNNVMATFWNRLKELESLGLEKKELIEKFSATGLVHDWACSYCGYGRIGLCKHYNKTEV